MNKLSDEKCERAVDLFMFEGCSIREVSEKMGIAKETAHRIQKSCRAGWWYCEEPIKVYTGMKSDGTKSFYITKEWQPQWGEL